MSDSRGRFEAWAKSAPREFDTAIHNGEGAWPGQYSDYAVQCAWEAWQAAEAETARRCAQAAILHNAKYMDYRAFDKIKAEFPEAFK